MGSSVDGAAFTYGPDFTSLWGMRYVLGLVSKFGLKLEILMMNPYPAFENTLVPSANARIHHEYCSAVVGDTHGRHRMAF